MIGIFDSGVGGLTVLRSLRAVLPSCDVVYFGDTKNAPYGPKGRDELARLTVEGLMLLRQRGATRIISACNSVSASLAMSLYDALSMAPQDLIEMVGPTVSYVRDTNARIVLCATTATVASGLYQSAFHMVGKEIEAIAIPELAGAIEKGASEQEIERMIRASLGDLSLGSGDVLVLACTHYPLVLDVFKRVVPEGVILFDPAVAVAERAERLFWPQEAGYGKTKFVISKDSEQFRVLAAQMVGTKDISVEVLQ